MKVGVIGDEHFCTGFRLAGVDSIFEVTNDLVKKFEQTLENEDIGILIIHDKDMKKLPLRISKNLEKIVRPVVITIGEGEDESNIRQLIKRCMGIDLYANR